MEELCPVISQGVQRRGKGAITLIRPIISFRPTGFLPIRKKQRAREDLRSNHERTELSHYCLLVLRPRGVRIERPILRGTIRPANTRVIGTRRYLPSFLS